MGQGTSSDKTGETEVMAINIGLVLAGSDQPGKPQVPSWPQEKMRTEKGRNFPKAVWSWRAQNRPELQALGPKAVLSDHPHSALGTSCEKSFCVCYFY